MKRISGGLWVEDSSNADSSIFTLAQNRGVPEALSHFLSRRSFLSSEADWDKFYRKSRKDLHEPLTLHQMSEAVSRTLESLDKNQTILVFGDFDVDGLCGASILYWGLRKARTGFKPEVYIPNRFTEGHGLSASALQTFAKKGVNLIITTDCGMGNGTEIALAKTLGMDVIVTDHHLPEGGLEEAYAVVNPKLGNYPFTDLAGSGVAYKFIQALLATRLGSDSKEYIATVENCIDYVAMGTIADVVPLLGENRILVDWGLSHMRTSPLPFLSKFWQSQLLNSELQEPFSAEHVGFKMAPRLNAASRLESPRTAFEFLTAVKGEEVVRLGTYLDGLNRERQERLKLLKEDSAVKFYDCAPFPLLVVDTCGGELGLLGLLASELAGERGQAVIALGRSPEGLMSGSARGGGGLHLQELLQKVSGSLQSFGGHREAAGLKLRPEDFENFMRDLKSLPIPVTSNETSESIASTYDCHLKLASVDEGFMEVLDSLGPFGQSFERPICLLEDYKVQSARRVGREGKELSFRLSDSNGRSVSGIGFGMGERSEALENSSRLVGYFSYNYFRERQIQLRLIDILEG
jgi:single-stranded-DNA-specific exonuclease